MLKEYTNRALEYMQKHRQNVERALEQQCKLWNGEKPHSQPLLLTCDISEEEDGSYPVFNTKEIHYDKEKMLMYGLREALSAVKGGAGAVPSVRANMGCGIFPTLFGLKQELFEDKMPWMLEHLSKEQLSRMGPEDLKLSGEFKAGLEHMEYMAEMLAGTGCMVYPMDLQGAFDTAHIVYGDAIFYDLYDDPGFVHHLLDLSCEAIFLGMDECLKVMPHSSKVIAHYNSLAIPRSKGGIKISEDTSTLLSREHIEEFVVPYMNRILSRFGGGYIHYCGKNPHLFEAVMDSELSFGFNLGNTEMHDMEYVLKRCADKGKIYFGPITGPITREIPERCGEDLKSFFKACLKTSRKDYGSLLLLQHHCRPEERSRVLEVWTSVNEELDTSDQV